MALMILRECRFSPKEKNDNPQIDSLSYVYIKEWIDI
jgi:hypothetical protein